MILDSMPTVALDFDDVPDGSTVTNNAAANKSLLSLPPDNLRIMTSMMNLTSDSQNNLDFVTNFVDLFLQADSFFPKLTDLLNVAPGVISISGRRDLDYPNLEEYGNSLKTLSQFVGLKTIPLPKVLMEQFGQMVQRCEMGIFTEIGRAWLAIDTNVYLWKYDTGADVAYYDALSKVITKVQLVKPKPDVFKPHIKYILILVTYTEIILLGITFSDINNLYDMGDLLVIPEPIFTLPTDNVEVKVIESSKDGRIFFGGNDGSLYEIYYQANNSWFGQNCSKINHSASAFSFLVPKILRNSKKVTLIQIDIDSSRNILYTLNEEGDIEVFDLGADGKSTTRVLQKSISSISREAIAAAGAIDEVNFKSIVSINSIEECESIHLNLVAVTKTGVRLYFTTTSFQSPEQRPSCLTLVHIRLPPGFAASSISHRPNSVQISHYKKGNFIFISYQNDNKDTLWALSSDSFMFKNMLSELYSMIPLKTRIWSMAEEQQVIDYKPYQSLFLNNKTFVLETPSIVTQHIELPKKFIFLTTQGVIIGYKPRLVDQLKQLLVENQGYDNESVKSFFHLHNSTFQSNACVFALILACDLHPTGDEKISEWATSAFFHYGNDLFDQNLIGQTAQNPHQLISTPISSPGGLLINQGGDQISTPGHINSMYSNLPINESPFKISPINRNFGIDHSPINAQSPHFNQQQQTQSSISNFPLTNCSTKCRGLFIYFSRIIRPIWNLKTVNVYHSNTPEGPKEYLTSNISVEEIKVYLLRLNSLYNFLMKNMKFSENESTKYNMNLSFSMNDQQVWERNLIYGLFKLIEHCLEVLNLWKLLCIHQFHVILSSVTKEKQTQLANMNFKEVIVFGFEMTTILASALVRRFIEDHSTTDIINKRLQDVCPSIYKNENALHAKVHEMVFKSKSLTNENDRTIILENALKICKKIGPRINLQSICDLLQSVHCYDAIVDICLTTAQKRDPQGLALHYSKNKDKLDDHQQGKAIYNSRVECYKLLLDVYGRLTQQSKSLLNPISSASNVNTNDYLNPEDAKQHALKMLRLATQSNDELFHHILYDWLYSHNESDKLLEIKSSYLEAYLKEKTSEINDSIELMDFLWLYYERNGHFSAAAQILAKLAELKSDDIRLFKRIEYLSRAIVCMKSLDARLINNSFGVIGSAGEFLHNLEEKIEVARIQLQLLNCIESTKPLHYENAIKALNSSLLNVTILYQEFAEPFHLYECQLRILHCAGHDDITLIENIWRNILDNELRSVAGHDPQTQIRLLKCKIKELGTFYLSSDKFFPIELIITILESSTQLNSSVPFWLVETFLELKIYLIDLYQIYHKIYKSQINHKSSDISLDAINLLEILIYLMYQLDQAHLDSNEMHYFISNALDLISGYHNDLLFDSTFDAADSKIKKIRSDLHKVKLYLERIMTTNSK